VIVLDRSVLVGIVKGEPEVLPLLPLIEGEDCAVGAPSLVAARMWCMENLRSRRSRWLEIFVQSGGLSVVPFGLDMANAASNAYAEFGPGSGHEARLDFGDCMAYAAAAVLRAPLLFTDARFALTDVMAHPASLRG